MRSYAWLWLWLELHAHRGRQRRSALSDRSGLVDGDVDLGKHVYDVRDGRALHVARCWCWKAAAA